MAKNEKKVGIISAVELKRPKYKAIYWSMYAFLMLCVFINLFPTIWIMLSGFKEVKEIYSIPPTLFPKELNLSKLYQVWQKLHLGRNYLNSLFIVLGDVAFAIIVNALGGYVISKLKPKGTMLVFSFVVWTMMMPSAGRTVPIYMEIVDFPLLHVNMTNTYLPMWLMSGANCFSLLMFKNFFDSISASLVEAAKMDGATDLGIFFKILLPLSVPIVTYIGITAAQGAWGAFFWPNLVLDNQEMIPMATKLYRMKLEAYTLDEQFLALIFSIVPSLLVFVIFQKQIMGGINVGGVKG